MKKFAFQAIAVVLLAALVYIAILRPPSDTPRSAGGDAEEMKQYSNTSFGLVFTYPAKYILEDRGNIGDGHRGHWALVLTEDTEENRAVREGTAPPRDGPPAITVDIFQNLEGYDALAWVKGSSDSNYKLGDGMYATTMVAGIPTVVYLSSGLYETKNVVFVQGDSIYKLSVGWLTPEDRMLADFDNILRTVTFAE